MQRTEVQKNTNISKVKLLGLIFIPTSIAMVAYFLIGSNKYIQETIPSYLLFFTLVAFILMPFQLGVVLFESKKEFGKYSLKSAFLDYEKKSIIKIVIYSFVLLMIAGLASTIIVPFETMLFSNIMKCVPTYFDFTNTEFLQKYPKDILIITGIVMVVVNGFIAPIIEELFFRGYLTSMMSRFGKYAPLIITVLFSLYHFWSPFQNIFRIIAFLPIAYITWKQKNIYIAITTHIMVNCVGSIGMLVTILNL